MQKFCPVCLEPSERFVICKAHLNGSEDFDLVECANCHVRYLDPLPTPEQLEQFYAPHYYGRDWYKQKGLGMAFARSILNRRKPGEFLDIGCGLGYFIKGIAENSKWKVCGIEFSPEAADHARTVLGLDVTSGGLRDAAYSDARFDYIQIRNVLEHVVDPRGLMTECRRILKPDGVLHLFVPNGPVDSNDLIKFARSEGRPALSPSGHLFFFSARSLKKLFEDTGFTMRRTRTLGLRRGLASLGYWPRIKDWKKHYRRNESTSDNSTSAIQLPPMKKRPDIYYRYRHFRFHAKMLPGLRSFGLDYELILVPKR
jgi:SAM-dependent methyltransferase